jgi:hypothetical protein
MHSFFLSLCSFVIYLVAMVEECSEVDDLVIVLFRFLLFLVCNEDSFFIPPMQDFCLKKQILIFGKIHVDRILAWLVRQKP